MSQLLIDFDEYGRLIKEKRKEEGKAAGKLITASALSSEIERLCGKKIESRFIYKVQDEGRLPRADEFFAINYALWGDVTPTDLLGEILRGQAKIDFFAKRKSEAKEYLRERI